jgi:hypothetical protein
LLKSIIWGAAVVSVLFASRFARRGGEAAAESRKQAQAVAATVEQLRADTVAEVRMIESAQCLKTDECAAWASSHGDEPLAKLCAAKAPIAELLEHVAAQRYTVSYAP